MADLSDPIIILGAARSGTKLLPEVLYTHPEVAYWGEPNYVWRTGNAHLSHDMIPAHRATPQVRRRIRERFAQHVAQKPGARRFCEKTPANTLRLPFVMEVLPGAKVVHIVRDGRDAALSARMRWQGTISKFWTDEVGGVRPDAEHMWERLVKRLKEVEWQELPYYVPRQAINFAKRVAGGQPLWGPRVPGLRELVRSHTLLEVCALQWRLCVDSVLNAVAAAEGDIAYYELKYESLCQRPEKYLREVFSFIELEPAESIEAMAGTIKAGNTQKWKKRLSPGEQRLVVQHIGQTLRRLNYEI